MVASSKVESWLLCILTSEWVQIGAHRNIHHMVLQGFGLANPGSNLGKAIKNSYYFQFKLILIILSED